MSASDAVSDRIVVGVDGSSASRLALRCAVQISAATGLRVDAIHAWQVPRSLGWQVHAWRTAPDRDAAVVLSGIVDEVLGENKPVGLRLLAEQGSATRVLLEHSRTVALLLVGSRGLGGFAGLLMRRVWSPACEAALGFMGWSPVEIAARLGHSKATVTTKHYARRVVGRGVEIAEGLDRVYRRSSPQLARRGHTG